MAITLTVTNAGLDYYRDLSSGAVETLPVELGYFAIGTGLGVITTALTNGSPYTSLTFSGGILTAISNGQSVTICNSAGTTQVITCSGNAILGATSVSFTSFNANANYANGSSAAFTPAAGDTLLQTEAARFPMSSFLNGGSAGVVTLTMYQAPALGLVTIAEAGIFAGPLATSTINTGVLIGHGIWCHLHANTESINHSTLLTI